MAYFLVPDAILFKFAHFSEIQLVCDRRTHGRTDRPPDPRTDRHTLFRTHLKKVVNESNIASRVPVPRVTERKLVARVQREEKRKQLIERPNDNANGVD